MINKTALHSNAIITGFGCYVPEKVLTNADLVKMVDTNEEWIVQRTGIHERRIAAQDQFTSHLSIAAVQNLVQRYPSDLSDVDYIIVATSTADTIFPSVAAQVQAFFNIPRCGAVDIQAACAGFVNGLQLANGLLLSGAVRKCLVIAADTISKITDYNDRSTCILFGDGAGALLLEASSDRAGDIEAVYANTTGSSGHHVYCSHLADRIGEHSITPSKQLVQNGREVYRWAVSQVSDSVLKLLADNTLTPSDIDWFIPHSANLRIVQAICERTGISMENTATSMEYYGNTSAASIPLAIDAALTSGKLKKGQRMLLAGFGGGLTEAGVILRWNLH